MDLAHVPAKDLAEQLVAVAQRARKLANEGATVALADLLAEVRVAADDAEGPAADLLEVAEAFLRALSRSNLGKTEIALHRFVAAAPDEAARLLGRLVDGGAVSAQAIDELGEIARPLVEVGALCELDGRRYNLRPSLRNLARDLIEPAPFRMWQRVQAARGQVALGRFPEREAAAYLASQFGVTEEQARRHLHLSPLAPAAATQATVLPVRRSGGAPLRVIYRRTEDEGKPAELSASGGVQADVTSEPSLPPQQVASWS